MGLGGPNPMMAALAGQGLGGDPSGSLQAYRAMRAVYGSELDKIYPPEVRERLDMALKQQVSDDDLVTE